MPTSMVQTAIRTLASRRAVFHFRSGGETGCIDEGEPRHPEHPDPAAGQIQVGEVSGGPGPGIFRPEMEPEFFAMCHLPFPPSPALIRCAAAPAVDYQVGGRGIGGGDFFSVAGRG